MDTALITFLKGAGGQLDGFLAESKSKGLFNRAWLAAVSPSGTPFSGSEQWLSLPGSKWTLGFSPTPSEFNKEINRLHCQES